MLDNLSSMGLGHFSETHTRFCKNDFNKSQKDFSLFASIEMKYILFTVALPI